MKVKTSDMKGMKGANHDSLFIYFLNLRRIWYILRCDKIQQHRRLVRMQCRWLLGSETKVYKVGCICMHASQVISTRQQAKCNLLCSKSSSGNQARCICMMKLVRVRDWRRTALAGERWVLVLPFRSWHSTDACIILTAFHVSLTVHSPRKTMSGYNIGSTNLLGASPTPSGITVLTLLNQPVGAGVASLAAPLEDSGRRFDRGPVMDAAARVCHRN